YRPHTTPVEALKQVPLQVTLYDLRGTTCSTTPNATSAHDRPATTPTPAPDAPNTPAPHSARSWTASTLTSPPRWRSKTKWSTHTPGTKRTPPKHQRPLSH